MLLDTERFNTDFLEKECPKCHRQIKPVASGKTNEVHGYELRCPLCRQFIGWGGKKKAIKPTGEQRKFSTQWTPKRLGIELCQMCLRERAQLGENETLHSHHVIPVDAGGQDTPANIWVVCSACHTFIHHRRTYLNYHLKPFFKAYEAYQRLRETRPELFMREEGE